METSTKSLKPLEQKGEEVQLFIPGEGVLFTIKTNEAQPPPVALNNTMKLFIGQTPLSFNDYLQYPVVMGGKEIPSDRGWGMNNMPAVNISLIDIAEYYNFLNPRVPFEVIHRIKQRMLAVDPNYQFIYPIPDRKEEWKGFPPPYYIDKSTSLFYTIPYAPGYKMPEEVEWMAVKGNIEELAKKEGIETYGHVENSQPVPYRTKKGHSVNGIDDGTEDPENMAYDVYGNVNEMGPELNFVNNYNKEMELINKYYQQSPEWKEEVSILMDRWVAEKYNK